jgi:hypothetical protein
VAAAAIVWLLSGGIVGVALDGTFEESDLFGGSRTPATRRAKKPRAGEDAARPRREDLQDWLVAPEP